MFSSILRTSRSARSLVLAQAVRQQRTLHFSRVWLADADSVTPRKTKTLADLVSSSRSSSSASASPSDSSDSATVEASSPASENQTESQTEQENEAESGSESEQGSESDKPDLPSSPDARKPATFRQIELAAQLLEHGAPFGEELRVDMTQREMSVWIDKAAKVTKMPPTPSQIKLVQALVQSGAPFAEEVHDGMTYSQVSQWLTKVQVLGNYSTKNVPKGTARKLPATENALKLAADLGARAGLEPPYDKAKATRGEVSDFIHQCRNALLAQGKPTWAPRPEEKALPATEGQRRKLRLMGVDLPEGATRGQASEKITELQERAGAVWVSPEQRAQQQQQQQQ